MINLNLFINKKWILHFYAIYKTKLYLLNFLILLFVSALSIFAQNNQVTMDTAIQQAGTEIKRHLFPGAVIALTNIASDSPVLSDYIMEELMLTLMENDSITVLDKNALNRALALNEINFQLSGNVSDETQVSIGNLVNANLIVKGAMSVNPNGNYRFRISLLNITTSNEILQFERQVIKDNRINTLLSAASRTELRINNNPVAANEFIFRAGQYSAANSYANAISDYTEAIKFNPANIAHIYALRGTTYWINGDMDKAIEDLSESIRRQPGESTYIYYVRARVYAAKGSFDRALEDCNIVIQRSPSQHIAYMLRALIYIETREYNNALRDANAIINSMPDDLIILSRGYTLRSVANMYLRNYQNALADIGYAIQHDPSNPDNYGNRGIINLRFLDNYDQAVNDFETASQLDPQNHAFQNYLRMARRARDAP